MTTPDPNPASADCSCEHGASECLLCPWCALVQALSSVRPEVTEHLAAAGQQLALAARALLEGSRSAPAGGRRPPKAAQDEPSLRRITLE